MTLNFRSPKQLDIFIYILLGLVISVAISSITIYVNHFDGGLSSEHQRWGTFGDYFGGILNPIVALSAFILLAISIRIQKEELSETRNVLEESNKAQEKQATQLLLTARVNAINAQISAIDSEIMTFREETTFILSQLLNSTSALAYNGERMSGEKATEHIDRLSRFISERIAHKKNLVEQLSKIEFDIFLKDLGIDFSDK